MEDKLEEELDLSMKNELITALKMKVVVFLFTHFLEISLVLIGNIFLILIKVDRNLTENLVGMNIAVLVMLVKQGRLDPTKPITIFELINNRIISDPKEGIKLLGRVF